MPILFFLAVSFLFGLPAHAASLPEERRIEEEKRQDLKATEAQYYDSTATKVDQETATRDYFDRLMSKNSVNYGDAAYVIGHLTRQQVPGDTEGQKKFLLEQNVLPKKIAKDLSLDRPLARGEFAYMLFRMLGLKGGLTLRVLGPSARYAHKELVFEKIMISGSTAEVMSGRELTYSFVQAAEYIAKHNAPPVSNNE